MSHPPATAPLMLSVSGARGIVGASMTPSVAVDFAAAFGSFLRDDSGKANPWVCLGRDSRPSGQALTDAVAAGLESAGCGVIRLGVVPTPTVGVMIAVRQADGGMVVTASHNPGQWNGLKCLNGDGAAPPPADMNEIIRRFKDRDLVAAPQEQSVESERDESGIRTHVLKVVAAVDVSAIRAAGLRVALDSINGAGCESGPSLLAQLGCEVVHLNGEPHGRFTHAPEPVEENLADLIRTTPARKAACGFAQDPDADRLAIVDERGRYIGEECTLALAALGTLETRGPGVLAANLSTSRMIDDIAARFPGCRVIRTPVGEAHVVAAMRSHQAILGGEGNGGVIVPAVCWVRDSLSSMALVLDLMARRRKPLVQIVDELPRYEMIKHKFDASKVGNLTRRLEQVASRFSDARVNTSDGVRVDVEDGWVHLRPSNTEPIVRLIAEARTRERAWELMDEVAVAAGLK